MDVFKYRIINKAQSDSAACYLRKTEIHVALVHRFKVFRGDGEAAVPYADISQRAFGKPHKHGGR